MEIFNLLEAIEEIIANSKFVPFSHSKRVVDGDEILNIIKEIRLNLPDELTQAKWIKEERNRIIQEAQKEGEDIVKEAENRIIAMIDEHEITKKAYEEKQRIIDTANDMSKEISNATKLYADDILSDVENTIIALKQQIETAETTINSAVNTLKNNRKELK